jgi:hypothetical protein
MTLKHLVVLALAFVVIYTLLTTPEDSTWPE